MPVRTTPFESPSEAALRLWEEGFTVVPLGGPQEIVPAWFVKDRCEGNAQEAAKRWPKTPRIKWKEFQSRAVTEAEIQGWAAQWPAANWAILTGKEIVVVDADTADAVAWVESGAITRCMRWVDTAHGRHYWFARNPNIEITNSVGKQKLDMRGFGGYVVAPGSVHAEGVIYTEHCNSDWPDLSPAGLTVLSADDLAAINTFNGGGASTVDSRGNLNFTASPVFVPGELAEVGGRNHGLAQQVGSWVGHGASIQEIMQRAHGWNEQLTQPLPVTEVDMTAASIVATHLRNHPEAVIAIAPIVPPLPTSEYFVSASDMVAGSLRPLPYLIRHYLLADSLALIFGAPGSGKSVVAMDWAICVALGRPWQGKAVRQGAVFYVAGEGHHGLGRRLMAWQQANDTSLDGAPLYFTKQSVAIYDRFAAEKLAAAIYELSAITGAVPVLICIDTLARNFGPGDENSTKDMSQFIMHVELLLQKKFGACVLLVHHTSKAEKGEARGNGALKGAVDTEFAVIRDVAGAVVVQAGKIKDGPTPTNKVFDLQIITLPIPSEFPDEPETSVVLTPRADLTELIETAVARNSSARGGGNKSIALDVLSNLYQTTRAKLAREDLDPDEAKVTVAYWRTTTGLNPKRFNEAFTALQRDGMVRHENPFVFILTPETGA